MANKTGENFHLGEYCETIGLHNPLTQIALNQKLCFAQIKRKDAGEDEVATQEIATPCGHKSHLVKYWITPDEEAGDAKGRERVLRRFADPL